MEVIEKTYSIKEAAVFLGCSEWTLYQLVKSKEIQHYRIGNRIRFSDIAITKYIREQEKRVK